MTDNQKPMHGQGTPPQLAVPSSASLLETWIDEMERRAWFLY